MISRVGFNAEIKKLTPQHFGIFSSFLFLSVIAVLPVWSTAYTWAVCFRNIGNTSEMYGETQTHFLRFDK